MTAYSGPMRTTLDAILSAYRGTAFAPATVYIGLLKTMPTDNTGTSAVEMNTTENTTYARVAITCDTSHFGAPSGSTARSIANLIAETFAASTIGSGPITILGWALWDTATPGTGNMLWAGTFSNYGAGGFAYNTTDVFQVPISDLALTQQ
jgi:hypothetical protein